MSIDPTDIHLDPEQQKALAEFAEATGRAWDEILREALAGYTATHSLQQDDRLDESFYDAASRLGLVGSVTGCPHDLSTNPDYMEGFGISDT
jgi:predicted transcriptional regulator